MANALYFGDNLEVLRESIKDESVDLIYLDPPFNSNATYNVLFKTPKGHQSDAQIEAFDDTWHWGEHAEAAFADLMQQSNTDVAEVIRSLRAVLHEGDMMAYLAMMGIRLLELHRVLKLTESLYLHCDPTASHYLKIVLDQVFGVENFRNEIIWRRANAHNDPKRFGKISDTIFYYTKGLAPTWNPQFTEYRDEYYKSHYKQDEGGRYFRTVPVDAPRHGVGTPSLLYEWKGKLPAPSRTWAVKESTMKLYEEQGLIRYTRTGTPTLLQFADEMPGVTLQNIWADIPPVNPQAAERLGYPTQKPLALLERIITASSNEGDVVLDPFCGCGTAVDAAEKLKRHWIGIDVTHLAVSLIEKRMRDRYPAITFEVHGTPKDFEGARNLAERDKYQFQWWACSLVNAQPYQGRKKGADSGIDGVIYFQDDDTLPKKIVVSVKSGENVSVAMVRDFAHVIDREKAAMGFFVTLTDPTKHMVTEGVGTGYYTSPLTGAKFPRLQVLTIEGLLAGTEQARYPRMDAGGLTFKKAKREESAPDQKKLL